MKFNLLVILLIVSNLSFAQIKTTKIYITKLPKGISYLGHITNTAKWTDSFRVHYVFTTQTGEYYSKDKETNEVKNAELFAYHFIKKGDRVKLLWKIYDFNKNCEFDVITKFIDKAFTITDLDKNGIAEVWVMYENQCTSDVSPAPIKIIMYEGSRKYTIRGESKVKVSENDYLGGEYVLDENFKNGNPLFKQFGINLWDKNNVRKWQD